MPNHDSSLSRELLSHQSFLRRLAADLVGNDADDLVQDVWQRALERPPQHDRQLRGWLARVARHLAANRWRSEARRSERERVQARTLSSGSELEARLELRKEIVEALDTLSPLSKETVLLRYFEGLAPREIAAGQGVPVSTVKTRLQRGLAQLRVTLDRRFDGDRGAWLPAVTALAVPASSSLKTGALVSGGLAMGTIMKVSAAVLALAAGLYFASRPGESDPPHTAAVAPPAAMNEHPQLAGTPETTRPPMESADRTSIGESDPIQEKTLQPKEVLRVTLEGIGLEEARVSTITLWGLDERDSRPTPVTAAMPCQSLATDFDLAPFLSALKRQEGLRQDVLVVVVDHPYYLGERTRVTLADGVRTQSGQTIYEARIRLSRTEFWPEFSLAVRDKDTRQHLENVEIRIRPGPGAAFWGRNNAETLLADGLTSPIVLRGGRNPNDTDLRVAGLANSSAPGEQPRLVQLARRFPPHLGVVVAARAPGYAWDSVAVDVTQGDRELLLEPAAALHVQLANVQLARYAALETKPMLCVYWIREDGGNQYVHFEPLGESLTTDGLRLESLIPGGYRVAVELGEGSWTEQPVLALEEVSLVAGETGELQLSLKDPPAPPERGNLGGVISFPSPAPDWSAENVRLQIYFQPTQEWRNPDNEFRLSELDRVGGVLPSWSFRLEDLPVGKYRVQLMPFLQVWMVDLSAEGEEDLELVIPDLAEVHIETIDELTGERVPRDELHYRHLESAPDQLQNDLAKADTVEPGLFRFWAVPGATRVWPKWPNGAEREYGGNGRVFELVPGPQSLEFNVAPSHAMFFVFREDGTVLPTGPQGLVTSRDILPVGHEGRVTDGGLQRDMRVEVSTPGLYEISFEGLDHDRYHQIQPRRVEVGPGETLEVIVDLRRK